MRIGISKDAGPKTAFIAVGTVFVDVDELYPSKGRLLIYEVDYKSQSTVKLIQRHEETVDGSLQSIVFMKEDCRYIAAAINQKV